MTKITNNSLVPFNKMGLHGKELDFMKDSIKSANISVDGKYSNKCNTLF